MYVGIAAHSEDPDPVVASKAISFLKELHRLCGSAKLVVGGYWGLMRVVVDEALKLGFRVLIVPPVEMENYTYPEEVFVVKTGLSFRGRSVVLVKTSDVLVVLGGGAGCIQEAVTAYTEGKPVFVLLETGYPTDSLSTWPTYLDTRMLAPISKTKDPIELARLVCEAATAKTSPPPGRTAYREYRTG